MNRPTHRFRTRLALALTAVATLGVALAAPTGADTTTSSTTTSSSSSTTSVSSTSSTTTTAASSSTSTPTTSQPTATAPAAPPTTATPGTPPRDPSTTASITGAATSIPLFIVAGTSSSAPQGTAIQINGLGELAVLVDDPSPELSTTIEQYYLQGGGSAYLWLTPDEQAATLVAATTEIARSAPAAQLFVIPGIGSLQGQEYLDVAAALAALADSQLGLALLDPPTAVVETVRTAWPDVAAMVELISQLQSAVAVPSSAALYATPLLDESSGDTVPAGVVMAGMIAQSDADEGVWASPAGTNYVTAGLEVVLPINNSQMGIFGPGVNVFVDLPNYGTVSWGARTLDVSSAEFRYLSTVRTRDWIQRSITTSLGWLVFEPNDPATQNAVSQAVSSFLSGVWKQGGLQGAAASYSFQVSVGPDPTASDQTLGQGLEVRVGLALVYPAEFSWIAMNMPTGSG